MMAMACAALFCACNPFPKQQTDEAIQAVMKEFNAVGISAAVVKDGKIVYNNSFGYKNLADKTPLSNDDVMRIASISKSFTATSLLQLVDKGDISLDDDVSDLIGFKIRNPHHPDIPITLKMVLSHTAKILDGELKKEVDAIHQHLEDQDQKIDYIIKMLEERGGADV